MDQGTCDALAQTPGLLPLLHQLEAVSSGSVIGPLAERLLEELSGWGGQQVGEAIRVLRDATRAAKKKKAMARRQAMLASLHIAPPVRPTRGTAGLAA